MKVQITMHKTLTIRETESLMNGELSFYLEFPVLLVDVGILQGELGDPQDLLLCEKAQSSIGQHNCQYGFLVGPLRPRVSFPEIQKQYMMNEHTKAVHDE
jgi:hypothetical protein